MSIISEVINEVEDVFEVDIRGKDRTMMNNLARKAVVNALRNNYTTIELGRNLNRKHSTICHYWQTHHRDLSLEFYKNVYESARNSYKEKINMPLVTSYDLKDAVQEIKIKLSLLEEHLNHI